MDISPDFYTIFNNVLDISAVEIKINLLKAHNNSATIEISFHARSGNDEVDGTQISAETIGLDVNDSLTVITEIPFTMSLK